MGQVEDVFYAHLLRDLGGILWDGWLPLCHAWQRAEGGTAAHNPFNTTLKMPGSTTYNTIGVQNYPTHDIGVSATFKTLMRPNYRWILKAITSQSSSYRIAVAIGQSPWGTDGWLLCRTLYDDGE